MDARSVLNRLKYTQPGLSRVTVEYISRGAPGDRGVLQGAEITHLGRSFIETHGKSIPYHRVTNIYVGDECVFSRISPSAHCSSGKHA